MSDSWRLTVVETNKSRTINTDVGEKGAFVVYSAKGKAVPQYFPYGNEQMILDALGYPSATFYEVWEVIQYNKTAGCWVSAPASTGALYGGVVTLKTGTKALTAGISDPSTFSFAAVKSQLTLTTTDQTIYTGTLPVADFPYTIQSITGAKNGTDLTLVAAAPSGGSEAITGTGLTSGTIDEATGIITLTFSAANTVTDVVTVGWSSDLSTTAYFALLSASPRTDDEQAQVTYDTGSGLFTIQVSMADNQGTYTVRNSYTVSNIPNTFNGYNQNVYMEVYIPTTDQYIIPIANSLAYSTFTADTATVAFGGGSRGAAITLIERTTGWNYFQSKNTYPADVFIDTSADPGIPPLFTTLRTTYQKYRSYILPLPDNADATTSTTTKQGFSINSRGLSFYWNWGQVRESYNNTLFWSPLTGHIGQKYAAMQDIYNGGAPAWIDENGHGGQLSNGDILQLRYDPSESDLQALDTAGINPIIFDPTYGVMIVSDKTAQSPSVLSDTSYIPHSRLFDYIITTRLNRFLYFKLLNSMMIFIGKWQ
ncbi:MAG TPA: hypothetical protein VMV86_04965 [Methanosarcinales archaeon]|nr:hypothetical protein [Methanosarcinales archaeon]